MPLGDYIRETWQNAVTAINATRLNNIETGLDNVTDAARALAPVETVAALKTLTGVSNGEYRTLAAHSATGDGGHGTVRRNTALASYNEGTTYDHNTEAGGWERLV